MEDLKVSKYLPGKWQFFEQDHEFKNNFLELDFSDKEVCILQNYNGKIETARKEWRYYYHRSENAGKLIFGNFKFQLKYIDDESLVIKEDLTEVNIPTTFKYIRVT